MQQDGLVSYRVKSKIELVIVSEYFEVAGDIANYKDYIQVYTEVAIAYFFSKRTSSYSHTRDTVSMSTIQNLAFVTSTNIPTLEERIPELRTQLHLHLVTKFIVSIVRLFKQISMC